MREPVIEVGILLEQQAVQFVLPEGYRLNGEAVAAGAYEVACVKGELLFDGRRWRELYFVATKPEAQFELKGVVIGVQFHWERREDQRFVGDLKLIVEGDKVTAVNVVLLEEYLKSVISSEMSATSSEGLLRAHAVISRSWLLAQVGGTESILPSTHKSTVDNSSEIAKERAAAKELAMKIDSETKNPNEHIRWYDREDHTRFDVCADDHCQRYQGVTRQTTAAVEQAVLDTRGEVLMYEGRLCDARYSKSCGGAMELFEHVWEPVNHPYLVGKADKMGVAALPNLTIEAEAERWIRSSPVAFCNTADAAVLQQVLNDYDQETPDFYRWKVVIGQAELTDLLRRKLNIDLGDVLELQPVERGESGRLVKLRIVGSLRSLVIGKELEIRRALSESHLYSSAFVVDYEAVDAHGVPGRFVLTGAGWGHGVGLCQIGAAKMAAEGYNYQEILGHYYPGAVINGVY